MKPWPRFALRLGRISTHVEILADGLARLRSSSVWFSEWWMVFNTYVIAAYELDLNLWQPDFKTRKQP
jgi:hypothetical protein